MYCARLGFEIKQAASKDTTLFFLFPRSLCVFLFIADNLKPLTFTFFSFQPQQLHCSYTVPDNLKPLTFTFFSFQPQQLHCSYTDLPPYHKNFQDQRRNWHYFLNYIMQVRFVLFKFFQCRLGLFCLHFFNVGQVYFGFVQ